MAKKKAVKKTKKAPKKTHGELFEKHPNLIWLMPIFLVIAGIAVVVIYNSYNAPATDKVEVMEEKIMIDDSTLDTTTEVTDEMIIEE